MKIKFIEYIVVLLSLQRSVQIRRNLPKNNPFHLPPTKRSRANKSSQLLPSDVKFNFPPFQLFYRHLPPVERNKINITYFMYQERNCQQHGRFSAQVKFNFYSVVRLCATGDDDAGHRDAVHKALQVETNPLRHPVQTMHVAFDIRIRRKQDVIDIRRMEAVEHGVRGD